MLLWHEGANYMWVAMTLVSPIDQKQKNNMTKRGKIILFFKEICASTRTVWAFFIGCGFLPSGNKCPLIGRGWLVKRPRHVLRVQICKERIWYITREKPRGKPGYCAIGIADKCCLGCVKAKGTYWGIPICIFRISKWFGWFLLLYNETAHLQCGTQEKNCFVFSVIVFQTSQQNPILIYQPIGLWKRNMEMKICIIILLKFTMY